MHPQLEAVVAEFESASARLRNLAAQVPDSRWAERADPKRWSVAECVAHLVLTANVYLPLMDTALASARRRRDAGAAAPARYRRDALGWFLWRIVGPPARMRVAAPAAFVPAASASRADVLAEFDKLQVEQIARVRAADGLPLERVRVQSPFNARVSYNLYSCLTILSRHQHRHLWQAEQVWGTPSLDRRLETQLVR